MNKVWFLRAALEEKLKELERLKESPISSDTLSKELVQRFLQSAYTSRELLVCLIERIELTETKQIIIKFRFPELEAIWCCLPCKFILLKEGRKHIERGLSGN